jgi:hypothetical protein
MRVLMFVNVRLKNESNFFELRVKDQSLESFI